MSLPYYKTVKSVDDYLKKYYQIYADNYGKRRLHSFEQLFPRVKYAKILEIGCGGGAYSCYAASNGASDIVTVDIEKVCVKAAKQNIILNGDGVETKGAVCDASSLPFKDGSFNIVISIDVVEHIIEDKRFVKEIERILSPNGLLIIGTQNAVSLNFLVEGFINRVVKRKQWMGWDSTHIRFYTHKRLVKLLDGFDIKRISGSYIIPYIMVPRKAAKIALRLNDLLESNDSWPWTTLGWSIACIGYKKK